MSSPDPELHPLAVIHARAELAAGVVVGPYAVIGEGVTIGAGTRIGAHAVLEGPTELGRDNVIGLAEGRHRHQLDPLAEQLGRGQDRVAAGAAQERDAGGASG